MHVYRVAFAFLCVVFLQVAAVPAMAQTSEPTFSTEYIGPALSPGRGSGVYVSVENTTGSPIVVSGVEITDLYEPTGQCTRVWFGDAGYPDRPRGEDEQNPPNPAYPLPSSYLDQPTTLQPGDSLQLPLLTLYMIEAAPNACQRVSIEPTFLVHWQFQQTYGTVNGTVTDSGSNEPLTSGTVTISGTTDSGVVTEELTISADGSFVGANSYLTGTEITVVASSAGYLNASSTTTVVEGANVINLALDPIPVVTGTVSGTAVDAETGDPIPNATIVLTGVDADGIQVSETLTSDASGQFAGTIQFQVGTAVSVVTSAPGYETSQSSVDLVVEGENNISPSLNAVQEEVPTETPTAEPTATQTPDPDVTETPSPEPTETSTVTPDDTATETPAVTPVTDVDESDTVQDDQESQDPPVVSTLPSTGTGSDSSFGLLLAAATAASMITAIGIRRRNA